MASDHLQTSDRNKIIDSLKALRDEVYKTGDADYAGRYLFTGFRTDTPLSFGTNADLNRRYEITETFNFDDCEVMTYVDRANLSTINEANYDTNTISEANIDTVTYYRYRLSYDEIDGDTALRDLVLMLRLRQTRQLHMRRWELLMRRKRYSLYLPPVSW